MRDILNVLEKVGAGSDTEETVLQTDHGIIPSDELQIPTKPETRKDNLKVYGRKFQR